MTRSAGTPGNPDQSLRKAFTVALTELYTKPIAGAPPAVALTPGAVGNLYLSRTGWTATADDGSGVRIYGAIHALFKYPDAGAMTTRFMSPLTVVPSRIVVRGTLEGETEFFDLDLFGPEAAEAQDLTWNGTDHLELRLTQAGAHRLRVKVRSTTVKVWPTRITITGSPTIDRTLTGEVDVLDGELASGIQHIAFAKPRSPVTLMLTQDGMSEFHVVPRGSLTPVAADGVTPRRRRRRTSGITPRRTPE